MASPKPAEDDVAALREQICRDPNGKRVVSLIMQYVCLSDKVRGDSHRSLSEICGDEVAKVLQDLEAKRDEEEDPFSLLHGEVTDLGRFRSRVERYLRCEEELARIYQTLVSLVSDWIQTHQKTIPFASLEGLQKEIWQAHDEKWIQQARVTTLYSDGEITSEKGGDLYGYRSVFTFAAPLLAKFELKLPLARGEHSYAILESFDVANAFRERMKSIASR